MNKKVLITGASGGLGTSLVVDLLNRNYQVIATSRDLQNLNHIKNLVNPEFLNRLSFAEIDVANLNSIKNFFSKIDYLDICINNAGIWSEGYLSDLPDELIFKTIEVNLLGSIYVTKYAIPLLQKSSFEKSLIVNISSTAGIEPKTKNSVYVASKYGIKGFTDALNLDLKDSKIKCIGVYPGGIATDLFKKQGYEKDLSNYMKPDLVAKIIVDNIENSFEENVFVDTLVIRRNKY